MNYDERPSPEKFLEVIRQEENQGNKGKLKIFLGMAAGVGKTYAMLEEAQKLKKEGIYIIVGTINTHGRQETAHLLKGLDVVPEKPLAYKEKEFKELDVKAITNLQPEVVLVDELAHNNTPGSKHAKRWQDVLEILDNGINVYTTLNVQHIESLNDVIKGITEISIRETVPDLVIERATSIQLIDLTPDALLHRLEEGKVYLGNQSKIAIEHFFKKDRLTAFREIVLRYVADKIDRDLRRMQPIIKGMDWKPREKFLVAISSKPQSQKIIRVALRLASSMNAPWIALHVENGHLLNKNETEQLSKNLTLARNLGAEILIVNASNISEGIKRVAYQRGVTQIILGRSPRSPFLTFLQGSTLLDKLVSECKDIDIHVIRQERYSISYSQKLGLFSFQKKITDYLVILMFVFLFTLINWFLLPYIGYKIVGIIFLLGILSLSLFFKKGPILFSSILYALIWDFFFIPPIGRFAIALHEDIALLILYPLTALTIGVIVNRIREQKELLTKSEKTTQLLYEIVRIFASNLSTNEMLKFIKERLKKFLDGTYEFMIKQIDDGLIMNDPERLLTNEKEKSVAIWAFENGKEAGWSTETLPFAQNLYIPLKGLHEVVGLLIFRAGPKKIITLDERNFLYTICQQFSSYLERSFVIEKTKQHEQLKEIEKIHKTILDRLSRAFENPMHMTRNAIKQLKLQLNSLEKREIFLEIEKIENTFEAFIKILINISTMAQLSEGMVPLKKDKYHVSDVIEECCNNAKKMAGKHKINIQIQDNLPLIFFDYYLIYTLLYNLILNAIEHSPAGTMVDIEAKKSNGFLIISVADEGKGIPEDQLDAIFEKFYRLPEQTSTGIGLGLAIAKTIAEIHHGFLKVENLSNKGAKFSLSIPIEEIP